MSNEPFVTLSKDQVSEILSALETIVVSLDRIGSEQARKHESRPEILSQFLDDYSVFEKLSSARRILLVACDQQRSQAEVDALEEQLAKVPSWNAKSSSA
ncbi:MAG: hypothetical protein ABI273_04995 [Lacunisphaera sp.]